MPLSDQFLSSTGIRNVSRKIIMDNIFLPLKKENKWKVLVVDEFGMKIMSSCFKTEEVMSFNIALIEVIENAREPLPYLAAIYFLCPSVQNIGYLAMDFLSNPLKYLCFHLFFLGPVPPDQFEELLKYTTPGLVLTFKEVDMLFLAHESQVFTLNDRKFFSLFYDSYKELDLNYCSFVAMKLATFCSTLDMMPRIRYRRNFIKNLILAESLQREFDNRRGNLPSSSTEMQKSRPRCELLMLDRGFDCISPIIHEFTLQAMAYDLLAIEDDIYSYFEGENSETINEISVTESDPLWCKLRHEHIADVSKVLDGMAETNRMLRNHPKLARYRKLPELGEIVKKQLANKNYQSHIVYRHMANDCMTMYCKGVNTLAQVEQSLAMGLISGNEINDAKSTILSILGNEDYRMVEKLRLLLLYIFYCKGISKQDFDDLVTSSKLPFSEARFITNVLHLDIDVFRPGFCKSVDYEHREPDPSTSVYRQSKWVPALKNIIMSCIDGSLSEDKYPYLDTKKRDSVISEVRTGFWCKDRKGEYMSRFIVFVAGGITYSELRTVYEVMAQYKGWEIYIGGDSLLTPQKFMNKLMQLRCFISKD